MNESVLQTHKSPQINKTHIHPLRTTFIKLLPFQTKAKTPAVIVKQITNIIVVSCIIIRQVGDFYGVVQVREMEAPQLQLTAKPIQLDILVSSCASFGINKPRENNH